MPVAATLSLYIARQFVAAVLAMLAALAGLVCLFDFIELLRRSATKPDATFGLVVEIAALRLPYVAMQILPFAVLLGGIVAFWRLTRSSELIVARAAGVSAWQFLSAPLACALLLGAAATGLVSPLSSVMLARAETLDNVYLRSSGGPAALTGGQLWLRQADHGLDPQGVAILLARSVTLRGKVLQSSDVSVFRLSADDKTVAAGGGDACPVGSGRLGAAGCADDVAGPFAGAGGHDAAVDGPYGEPGARKLRVARYAVRLGAAGFHRAAGPVGVFIRPAPAAFAVAAGAAAAGGNDGAGFGGVFDAAGAAGAGWRR